ncbi:MAG: hypothetical protein HZA49_06575 [Planctomycetes bacterium]|nr:hypothetical protein [Planctomycetota bacterium]
MSDFTKKSWKCVDIKDIDWGQRFEFNEDKVDTYVSDLPGVYRLVYRTIHEGKDGYFVFYNGETDDLYKTLCGHLNLLKIELPPPKNPYNAPEHCIQKTLQEYPCYFRFIIVRSKKERVRIKKELDDSIIPKGEMEFAAWADNFFRVLSANADKWFPPAERPADFSDALDKFNDKHKKFMASYDEHLKVQINLRAAEKKLKDAEQKLKDEQQKRKEAENEGEEWKEGKNKPD